MKRIFLMQHKFISHVPPNNSEEVSEVVQNSSVLYETSFPNF